MNMPLDLEELLIEECYKLRIHKKDYIIQALRERLSKPQANSINVVYGDKDIILGRQQQLQPTEEEMKQMAMNALDKAIEEVLPFIAFSKMDVEAFQKWNKKTFKPIYLARHFDSKYNDSIRLIQPQILSNKPKFENIVEGGIQNKQIEYTTLSLTEEVVEEEEEVIE